MHARNGTPPACVLTTSWDDGHPLDLRLAELLGRYDCPSTFYVPNSNLEGLPVLSASEIRELLSMGFEIGSHTLDHCYLTSVEPLVAAAQINNGKRLLEDIIGQSVDGFCYPGGRYAPEHVNMVRSAGFAYARTTENFRLDSGMDPFRIPVTIQCYSHTRIVYMRNFANYGGWGTRWRPVRTFVGRGTFLARLKRGLDLAYESGGVFHLWGHSWELERMNLWSTLDAFLQYAVARVPRDRRLCNAAVLFKPS